ncbi:Abscisic acid G-protein coupled receptor-domain-containing protein [Phlebopus sp. FC_14]|nr:Abscisic acid G-protein coupled receptor-domain-containing protein [Phlebopus sp. FC_14]
MVLTYRSEPPTLLTLRAITFLLPVSLFLFSLSFIPLPPDLGAPSPLSASAVTARLVVLGTTVLGVLSGLGAVNGAWMVVSSRAALPSASSLVSAENALERVRGDLRARTRDFESYVSLKPQTDESWLSRMTFKRDTHRDSLQQEVIGLQALESQMTTRVAVMKRNRETAEFAQSIRGKMWSRTWAVYCACRVFSSVVNLLSPPPSADADSSSSYGDLIAHVLAYLLSLLPFRDASSSSGSFSIDTPSLSRQISLALVGVIILTSVRVVLKGVTRAFRITSRNISASLMLLLLAQLMGIYLLSTLVQLRTMFPPSPPPPPMHRKAETGIENVNLFSTLPEYSLFGGLFDWSFLLGATGCAFARWAGGLVGGGGGGGGDDVEL